jgi:3-hydroxybutyryl-CoA dehydrogenase/5-formyl-3-hydroxy-2-methylpyridine 4-carboxylate dehydrogenase
MKTAAVVGLGTMGPGIAATLAKGGMDVRTYDLKPEVVEKAKGDVQTAFGVLERIGRPKAEKTGAVTFHNDLAETVSNADLVIESVPEKADIKAQVFAELDRLARPDAMLASNTSGIPISKLQQSAKRPGRVIGMHWSNPPHVIPVIEVIAGAKTEAAEVEKLKGLINGLGLYPVVVKKDVPGFVENRVLYAIMRECLALAENGVIDPADLDTCVKWGIGFKLAVIGPLELLDVAGLDIYQAVASYLNADLDKRGDVSPMITERIKRGDLGMKSGNGIYRYTPEQIQQLRMARAGKLVGVRKTLEG